MYRAVKLEIMPTPIGELTLSFSRRGLERICFPGEDYGAPDASCEVINLNAELLSDSRSASGHSRKVSPAAAQLAAYFDGTLRQFDVAAFGLSPALLEPEHDTFTARVQRLLSTIPFGETRTYGEIAELAGSPRAVRAVGNACARNPLPILRPCHRVVPAGGSIGNYRGGVEAKRWLLSHEARLSA